MHPTHVNIRSVCLPQRPHRRQEPAPPHLPRGGRLFRRAGRRAVLLETDLAHRPAACGCHAACRAGAGFPGVRSTSCTSTIHSLGLYCRCKCCGYMNRYRFSFFGASCLGLLVMASTTGSLWAAHRPRLLTLPGKFCEACTPGYCCCACCRLLHLIMIKQSSHWPLACRASRA